MPKLRELAIFGVSVAIVGVVYSFAAFVQTVSNAMAPPVLSQDAPQPAMPIAYVPGTERVYIYRIHDGTTTCYITHLDQPQTSPSIACIKH